jgi:ubiquitin-activating enzyme E1
MTLCLQAAAILKAEVYGIPRPDWASDRAAVAAAVGKVVVPEFQPKQGVRIETDPKVRHRVQLSKTCSTVLFI